MDTTTLGVLFVALLALIFLVLILREVFCWYAKTNRILKTCEQILARLPAAAEAREEPPQQAAS